MSINSYKAPTFDEGGRDGTFDEPYDLNSSIPVTPLLETERVQLVPFIPAIHAEIFYGAFAKDATTISKYLPGSWSNITESLHFVEAFIRRDPTRTLFAIIDKTKPSTDVRVPVGRIAGIIGWLYGSMRNRSLEIGPVIVLPEFQRTFVSANAIGLLLRYVLDVPASGGLGFRRVAWSAHPHNEASIAAAQKMGFVKEGVLRYWVDLPPGREAYAVELEGGREGGNDGDIVLLSLCWDTWVSGARDVVVERMARV